MKQNTVRLFLLASLLVASFSGIIPAAEPSGTPAVATRTRSSPDKLSDEGKQLYAMCAKVEKEVAAARDVDKRRELASALQRAAESLTESDPNLFRAWLWQAQCGLLLNQEAEAKRAVKNMKELGVLSSGNPQFLSIVQLVEKRDWSAPENPAPPAPQENQPASPTPAAPPVDHDATKEDSTKAGVEEKHTRSDKWQAMGVTSIWTHNGSTVGLIESGNERKFVYISVSSKMRPNVSPGAILFSGSVDDGEISGQAKRFKKGFSPLEYDVHGRMLPSGKKIELNGMAPHRDDSGHVTNHVPDLMVFDFVRSLN